jgi:hypothetical protein
MLSPERLIYGTILPQGLVSGDDTGLIMRTVALSQADNLPHNLATALISDTAGNFSKNCAKDN